MIYVKASDGQPLESSAVLHFKDKSIAPERIKTNKLSAFVWKDWSEVSYMKVIPKGGHWKLIVIGPEDNSELDCTLISDASKRFWTAQMGLRGPCNSNVSVGVIDHASPSIFSSNEIEVHNHYGKFGMTESHGETILKVLTGRFEEPFLIDNTKQSINPNSLHFYNVSTPLTQFLEDDSHTTLAALTRGIMHLVRNTDVAVINISQGIYSSERSPALEAAVWFAQQNGVLCVAAAGNDSSAPVTLPARIESVIAVGGVGLRGIAPAGTYANHIERISKIASDTWFACPISSSQGGVDVVALSSGIVLTTSDGYAIDFEGTSYSCPMVVSSLTNALAENEQYRGLSGVERHDKALEILKSICRDLGLGEQAQGNGMPVCEVG